MTQKKSAVYSFLSNFIYLLSTMLVSLLIPLVLDYEGYAGYKTFTLFATYTAFFHFGFIDSLAFDYSDKNSKELSNSDFPSLFKKFMLFLISFVSILILFNFSYFNELVIFLVLIYSISNVLNSIHSKVFQYTLRFDLYAIFLTLTALLNIILITFAYIFNVSDFYIFIVINISLSILMCILGFIYNFNIYFSKDSISSSWSKLGKMFLIGLPLTLGTYISQLALGLDRFFIKFANTDFEFATYAFAFSLVNIIFVIVNSLSTIILPYLKRQSENSQVKSYHNMTMIINIFFGLSILGIPIVVLLINLFLSKYNEALNIFIILYPITLYKLQHSIKQNSFIYVVNQKSIKLVVSIISLLLGLGLNYIVYYLGLSYNMYAVMTLISFLIMHIIMELFFIFKLRLNASALKDLLYTCLIFIIFVYCFYLDFDLEIKTIILSISVISLVVLFYIKDIIILVKNIIKR